MTEPFYGAATSSPMWPGPTAGFGFPQTALGMGPLGLGLAHGAEGFGSPNVPQLPFAGFPAVGPGFPTAGMMPGLPHPSYALSPLGFGLGGGLMSSGQAFLGPPTTAPGAAPGPGSGSFPGSGGYLGAGGFELPPGITAPAVVAAIAMRRGQPHGPANDQDIEEFIYDALELLPGANDVEVRAEGGRVTLTGGVQQKRLKHDVGEIAWAIPSVNDVMNNVTIASKRRSRAGREAESQPPGAAGRKQP